MKKVNVMLRSVGMLAVSAMVLSVLGCVAAIPIAVKYYKDQNQTVAKAEMAVPAEKVYATAVSMAEEKDLKVLKKEDEKLYLEVTDGKQTASFKAEATDKGNTIMTIMASLPPEETKEQKKEEEKELALRIVNRVCERLEVQCTITKQ